MKLYLKVALTIFFVIFILLAVKTYQNYLDINEKMRMRAQKNSSAISSLVLAYNNVLQISSIRTIKVLKHTQKNIFREFARLNKNQFFLKIITQDDIKKGKSLSSFEKKGIRTLQKRKEKLFYSEEVEDGRYFYVSSMPKATLGEKDNPLEYISIVLDAQNEKQKMLTDFYISSSSNFLFALVIFALFYLTFQEIQNNDRKYMQKLQDEVNKKTKNINEKNEKITYQLYHNALTKLPNRVKLLSDLANTDQEEIILALINIDRFKEINDFYGQDVGDEVLVSFSGFLRFFVKDSGAMLYKLHADEYAFVWKNISKVQVEKHINNLNESIKNFVIITEDDHDIEVTATIGIAIGDENALAHADMALKRAKKEHIQFLTFDDSMEIEKEYQNNITWTQKLKKAIKDDKIVPFCQPIAYLEDKAIDKYEVLARLIDKDDKIINPYFFLEIAKKNKLYSYVTHAIINKSFNYFKDTDQKFSINISILDVADSDTVKFLLDELKAYPKPKNITFEILESEGIENYSEMIDFIDCIKAFGCKIAIDDFGAGYSNFAHLLNLKVDLIKLDASLIKHIDINEDARIIVRTIVSFAKSLNIETCAEFVHSEAVYDTLLSIGVTYVQGYYISEPVPIEDIV